jgi:tetrahydromethanopterin S-methyltransferase subunit H
VPKSDSLRMEADQQAERISTKDRIEHNFNTNEKLTQEIKAIAESDKNGFSIHFRSNGKKCFFG